MTNHPPIGDVLTMYLVIDAWAYGGDGRDRMKRPRVFVADYAVKAKTLQLVGDRRWPIPSRLWHDDVGRIVFSDLRDAVNASIRMAEECVERTESLLREANEALAMTSNDGSEMIAGRLKPLEGR